MFGTAFRDAVRAAADQARPALEVATALASAAADGALGLPPPLPSTPDDVDLLRLAVVLATLCKAAYTSTVEDVGRVTSIPLPPPGGGGQPRGEEEAGAASSSSTTAAATLLHFREAHAPPGVVGDAAAGGPQQFGVWRVKGFGLVVAFRGTATRHDALVDAALAPSRLGVVTAGGGEGDDGDGDDDDDDGDDDATPALYAHHGFLTGARRHAGDIARLVARFNGGGGRGGGGESGGASTTTTTTTTTTRGPVWLTGHSLGGAYATALGLDLLARADGSAARLFGGGGGGVVTFGAPMVLCGPPLVERSGGRGGGGRRALAPRPAALRATHARLAAAEAAHLAALRQAGIARPPRLAFVAFVSGADIVPRALGSPLGGVTGALGSAVPVLAPAHALAARYRPVGSCLLLVGGGVRATGAAPPAAGGVGTLATSDDVSAHLHAGRAWAAVAAGSAALKVESAHDLATYLGGLRAAAAGRGRHPHSLPHHPRHPRHPPSPSRRTRRRGGDAGAVGPPPPDALAVAADLGRALGDASAAAADRLRAAAARTAVTAWRSAAAAAVLVVSARFGGGGGAGAGMEREAGGPAAAQAPDRKRRWLGRKGGVGT